MTATVPATVAWRFFDTRVAGVTDLSPTFRRITLTGPDLDEFADNGWDQRFKVVLPDAHGSYDALPRHPDWHGDWRRLPADRQNPLRTYTVRAVRPRLREVDVDVVLHGDAGPASRFARRAAVGQPLVVLGPNAAHGGPHGGVEFRPPDGHTGPVLLVGDATAVPAVLSVLEQLRPGAHGEAILTVPHAEDVMAVRAPAGVRVRWLVEDEGTAWAGVPAAVDAALVSCGAPTREVTRLGSAEPVDDDLLWEVPEQAHGDLYAWIAGESSAVTGLRRLLVRDRGVDRRSVAFMGYWRRGRQAL